MVLTLGNCWRILGSFHSHPSLRRRTCHGLRGATTKFRLVSRGRRRRQEGEKKKINRKLEENRGRRKMDERKPLEKEEEGEQGRN